jgi:hypothetical protein
MDNGLEKLTEILREKFSEEEVLAILGHLTIAAGNGSIAIDGDAAEAVIVTGNRNIVGDNNRVIINRGVDAKTIRKMLSDVIAQTFPNSHFTSTSSSTGNVAGRDFIDCYIYSNQRCQ